MVAKAAVLTVDLTFRDTVLYDAGETGTNVFKSNHQFDHIVWGQTSFLQKLDARVHPS